MSSSIACIVYKDNKIFIAKRQMVGDMGGRWEFPGGKIDAGEDCIIAIKREMQEEFGISVEVGEHITDTTFEHKNKVCYLSAYEVIFPHDGSKEAFVLTEHTDYKWVDINEIPKLEFVDSDLKIYPAVKAWIEGK